jgi:hypothetical protein
MSPEALNSSILNDPKYLMKITFLSLLELLQIIKNLFASGWNLDNLVLKQWLTFKNRCYLQVLRNDL